MPEKNMGSFDRAVRIALGLALIIGGLILLDGAQGTWGGMVVAALGLLPLLAGMTGVCPLYIPFGISTYHGDPNFDNILANVERKPNV